MKSAPTGDYADLHGVLIRVICEPFVEDAGTLVQSWKE
jgi:hypothetical protein